LKKILFLREDPRPPTPNGVKESDTQFDQKPDHLVAHSDSPGAIVIFNC